MTRQDLRPAIKQAFQDRWIELLTELGLIIDAEHQRGEWHRARLTGGPERGNIVAISSVHGGWRSHDTEASGDCFQLIKLIMGIRFNEVLSLLASKLNLTTHLTTIGAESGSPAQSNATDGLCTRSLTSDGTAVRLTNFTAKIVTDITYDNGSETRRAFALEAHVDGETIGFEVTPADFVSGNWILDRLGPKARVFPIVPRIMPFVIDAVQEVSTSIERRTVFEHTGWRKVDDEMVYLHAGGAIRANQFPPDDAFVAISSDLIVAIGDAGEIVFSEALAEIARKTRVSQIEVRPPDTLRTFKLPEPPEGDVAMRLLKSFMKCMIGVNTNDPSFGVLMLAAIGRAPLGAPNFGIHVDGPTGSRKTSWALAVQQTFAPLADDANLPANWQSTSNAIMATLASLRDTVCVVDNYIPGNDRRSPSNVESKARSVIQGVGDGVGRARCRQDGTLRPRQDPSALMISTGEDTPTGESTQARLLVVRVGMNTIDPTSLSQLQRFAESGQSAMVMAGYIRWLAPRIEHLQDSQRGDVMELRRSFGSNRFVHSRTATIIAELAWGLGTFLDYAQETRAVCLSPSTRKSVIDQLLIQAARHQRAMIQADPAHMFVEHLNNATSCGLGHFVNLNGHRPEDPETWGWRLDNGGENPRWRPMGNRIGWISNKEIFLDPDTSYRLAQQTAGSDGDRLDVTPTMLHKSLDRNGFLSRKDVRRQTYKQQKMLDGRRRSVLAIYRGAFLERRRVAYGNDQDLCALIFNV